MLAELHSAASVSGVVIVLTHCHTVMAYWDTHRDIVNVISNTCALPAVTNHVCCERGLLHVQEVWCIIIRHND